MGERQQYSISPNHPMLRSPLLGGFGKPSKDPRVFQFIGTCLSLEAQLEGMTEQ